MLAGAQEFHPHYSHSAKIRLEKRIFRRNSLLSGSLNGNRDINIDGIHLTTPASPFDTARGNADSRCVSSM